jgi:hypothetical protein
MAGETHEFYEREDIKVGSDRGFGFVFTGVFAVVGGFTLWRDVGIPGIWFGASAVTLAFSFLTPQLLHPFNRVWHKFGLLLGRVTNPIVLGLLFFVAVTPTGLIMRLFGKDPLRLKRDPGADSFWILRDPPGPDPESLKQQF